MTCEHTYVNDKSELMIRIKPSTNYSALVIPFCDLIQFLINDEESNEYIVQKVYMTMLEVENMPEFTGW